MKINSFLFFSVILILYSSASFAQTTWVVDQGGGDFTTIQGCISDPVVLAGDTCQVNR